MSGIAGALLFDDAFGASDLVARVTDRMRYLGSDGLAHWSCGRVAMGQCMLRAVPEAAREALPLADSLWFQTAAWCIFIPPATRL